MHLRLCPLEPAERITVRNQQRQKQVETCSFSKAGSKVTKKSLRVKEVLQNTVGETVGLVEDLAGIWHLTDQPVRDAVEGKGGFQRHIF